MAIYKNGCAYCKQNTEWAICNIDGTADKPHDILFCPMCGTEIKEVGSPITKKGNISIVVFEMCVRVCLGIFESEQDKKILSLMLKTVKEEYGNTEQKEMEGDNNG